MNSVHFVRSFYEFCIFCILCEFCTLILYILYVNSIRFVCISVCEFCIRILYTFLCTNSVCKFCVQILYVLCTFLCTNSVCTFYVRFCVRILYVNSVYKFCIQILYILIFNEIRLDKILQSRHVKDYLLNSRRQKEQLYLMRRLIIRTVHLSVTTQSHLDDLITFGPSNDLLTGEHQPDPFDILLEGGRMDSEGETYLSYKEMSLRKLDSYYFRSD